MNNKILGGLIAFVMAAFFLTPYCGFLFDCGCTWPWAGLDVDCNNHNPDALHKCPWCGNYVKGFISSTIIIGGAALAAYSLNNRHLFMRMTVAAIFFVISGFITGWISAALQGYPHFII